MTGRRAGFWLAAAIVVVFFGLPLFTELGATDLKGDEPIYAFAIDRILDHGDWLTPRAIPSDETPFLEKPPVKFWIVAASMRAGLLPHDEFGYRFWDVIFGIAAFLFVLAIGYRISGVVCGLTADLVLFAHAPLVLDHGIRSNNMEAALLLAYCGGIYHALAWSEGTRRWHRWFHPLAVAFWFAFGFMVKFVAAIFLPATLFVTAVLVGKWRRRALGDWQPWLAACALALALILPWFIYEYRLQGPDFWTIIFGEHVFVRFTAYLDPAHLHPWYFYVVRMTEEFWWGRALVLVLAGLALLVYRAVRDRSASALLLLVWFALPLAAISTGTSKLYHYVYPFLPPLALGAGLVPAAVMDAARRYSGAIGNFLERIWPGRLGAILGSRGRMIAIGVAVAAVALAAITPILGGVSLRVGGHMIFRSSTVSRPLILATALLLFTGSFRTLPQALVLILLLVSMPFDGYRNVKASEVTQAAWEGTPMRTIRDCLVRLQETGSPRGVYVHTNDPGQWRYVYYLRQAGWNSDETTDDNSLVDRVLRPDAQRPVFLVQADYDRVRAMLASAGDARRFHQFDDVSRIVFDDDRVLLLPGPYASCARVRGAAIRGSS